MRGLMQDYPLNLEHVFCRAERLFSTKSIVTRTHTGTQRTTYGAWADRARRLGGALDLLGVSGDGRVGTFAWNSGSHLEVYFGVPCTSRVLHTLNIRLFAEQVVFTVNHAEDEVIFVDRSLLATLWPMVEGMPKVRHFVVMDDGKGEVPDDSRICHYDQLLAESAPVQFRVDDEETAAAICYTTGTTGNPKGVVYSHRSITLHSMMLMMSDTMGIRESDVVLPVVPMFHANAWGMPHASVFAGASLVFPGPNLSAEVILDLMERERVTISAGVPTVWMGVLPLLKGRVLPSLRHVACGGSAVPKALSEGFRREIGLPIQQAWGMTETSPMASIGMIKSDLSKRSEEELAEYRSYQGIIAPGLDMRIVAPLTTDELPWDGVTSGELQVRGPWIAADYYNDPRSKESFTSDGWLRTGDVATVTPEGYIHLVDRTKDLVKSGGEWISSVALENHIMANPKVAEAAVIGVPHSKWQERPLACVVVKSGEEMTKSELLAWLEPRVADWWLPDDVVFIDEVPKTSVGKFSKKDLRERFAGYKLPTEES